MIQLAGRTLVVSLPSSWAKEYGIEKGDEVEVDNWTVFVHVAVALEGVDTQVYPLLPQCLTDALGSELTLPRDAHFDLGGAVLLVQSGSVVTESAACATPTAEQQLAEWLAAATSDLKADMHLMVAASQQVRPYVHSACTCACFP